MGDRPVLHVETGRRNHGGRLFERSSLDASKRRPTWTPQRRPCYRRGQEVSDVRPHRKIIPQYGIELVDVRFKRLDYIGRTAGHHITTRGDCRRDRLQ
jgi:hypothetical protein